jgi:hypothetical protein
VPLNALPVRDDNLTPDNDPPDPYRGLVGVTVGCSRHDLLGIEQNQIRVGTDLEAALTLKGI